MTSIQSLAAGRKDMLMIDPRIIQEKPGWNNRHNTQELADHIRNLAESIKVAGVQKPLTVYLENDVVYVTDGHCRRKAVLLAISEGAKILTVPCLVAQKGASEDELLADQLSMNSGMRLSSLEIADVATKLMAYGWTIDTIAKRSCVTAPWLSRLLDLRAAPTALKEDVYAGNVSATLAADLVARKGGQKAVEIVAEAKERTGKAKITKKDLPKPPPLLGVTPTSLLRDICDAEETCDLELPPAFDAIRDAIHSAHSYLERMGK